MSTIAFIGLGIMGSPMAVHLQNAGHDVVGYNLHPDKTAAPRRGRWHRAASLAEAVRDAEVVAVMVPDSPDVQDVLLGEDGVFANAKEGTLVIDFSSIRPDVTVQLAKAAQDKGFRLLDAPVSGGEAGAKNAALSIMVGGAEATSPRPSRSSTPSARRSSTSAATARARPSRRPTSSSSPPTSRRSPRRSSSSRPTASTSGRPSTSSVAGWPAPRCSTRSAPT